jgi:hypothetical protein
MGPGFSVLVSVDGVIDLECRNGHRVADMRVPRNRVAKPGQRPQVVLGTQMAAAIEAEKRHQSFPRDPSPLTEHRYELTGASLTSSASLIARQTT